MEIKKIIRVCIVLFLIILPDYSKGQITSISNDSNYVYKFVKALITYDQTNIYIKTNGAIANKYTVPVGYYIMEVFYDRMTGLISFNKCHDMADHQTSEEWEYELMIWDFLSNKTWSIESGKSFNGEGLHVSKMCNYNPSTKTGILITYGWELKRVTQYHHGKSMKSVDLPGGTIDLLAIINEDSVFVNTSDESQDEIPFYSYNFKTGNKLEIDSLDVYRYRELMLSQFGKNINCFYRPIKRGIDFWKSDWNPEGNAVIFNKVNLTTREKEYYLYDYKNDHQELISTGIAVIPIWK
jgi:hypothetical protein